MKPLLNRDDLIMLVQLVIYGIVGLVAVSWIALALGLGLKIFQLVSH